MLKRIFCIMALLVLFTSCQKSTDPADSPLIGNWTLSTMKVNGAVVSASDYSTVPEKFLFSYTGSGTVWYYSLGKPNGSAGFTWNTGGSNLNLQITGGTLTSYTFSINDGLLTITNSSNYQYVFTKSVGEL